MRNTAHIETLLKKEEFHFLLQEVENYQKNRIKDEPVFNIVSEGLKLFFNSGVVKLAAFLTVESHAFTFKLMAAEPVVKFDEAEIIYSELLNEGIISSILQSGEALYHKDFIKKSNYLLLPLIAPGGVQGIIILEMEANEKKSSLFDRIFKHIATQIALLLDNNRLYKKVKNINNLLEQKLAYRTESIKQKKRELQIILDSINTGVFIIEKQTFEIIDVNHFALEMLGFDKLSVIGKNRKQFSPYWNYQAENAGEVLSTAELSLYNHENKLIPALNSIRMVNLNGQEYLLESFINISKIKNVERELRNSEYRFRTIFESATFGMVLTDEELRIIECNNIFRKMVGYNSAELKYRKIYDYVHKHDLVVFNKCFSSGVIINKHNEIRFVDCNKDLFWCRLTATVLKYNSEAVHYKLFMMEDITSIVASKDALYKQTNLLMGVADATNALLTLNDSEAAIKQAIESLGKASEVERVYIIKNVKNGKKKDSDISLLYEWQSENCAALNKTQFPEDFSYSKYFPGWYEELSDGRTIHGYINYNKIPGIKYIEPSKVKSIMIVPIFVDVNFWGFLGFDDSKKEKVWSEVEESILKATAAGIGGAIKIKESQEELLKAKNKAEKSDQLKSEFLAQMSHEIRTPINSILSFSGLIKDEVEPKLNPEYRACFNAINRAGDRIIRTVDMILNMSDLQTGSYEVNPSEYDLYNSLRANLSEEFLYKAHEKGLEFNLYPPAFPTLIKADEYTVNQIFANLIDNAIKYTSDGTVEILFENGNSYGFTAKVKDTGIGIAEEFIPKMFDPFTQEEQGYTRRYEGNGLGLALVKKYCDLSNVKIQVKSSKGVGTTFSLFFKYNHPA